MKLPAFCKEEGYILNHKLTEEGSKRFIRLYLKYMPSNLPVISRMERISRPGCRVYVGSKEIHRILGGLGNQHPDDPQGCDDRVVRAQRRRGRRSSLSDLVRNHVTSR